MTGASTNAPGADVREPLAESAPLMRALAQQHCRPDSEGCIHYHGFWQHLRLMGLGATLGGHPRAYLEAFAQWRARVGDVQARVLICGCADYSMLAHLLAALGPTARHLRIVAVDICRTPLAISEWYAERHGFDLETVQSDILEWHGAMEFDLITTSSFLGYFPPDERPLLLQQISRLLAPGGSFVSSNRLRPDQGGPVTRSEADIERFADSVARAGANLPAGCRLEAERLREAARRYARMRRPFPLRAAADIERLAGRAGLRVERMERLQNPRSESGIKGPTLDDGSPYVFFRLDKPPV